MSVIKMKKILALNIFLLSLSNILISQNQTNILLIIADDMGIDAIRGFGMDDLDVLPNTPNIDNLRAEGISYMNNWITPQCTPSRSSIISGKYGINTGVNGVPGHLDLEHESIFNYLKRTSNNAYSSAVIGKWQLSTPNSFDHPIEHGANHFEGVIGGGISDYYSWRKFEDGEEALVNEYATSNLTDSAIDWIDQQEQAWFLWLAHLAPHAPFQIPPDDLFTYENPETTREIYIASIEALDSEIGRLLDSLDPVTRANTLIIFVGDNGTPGGPLEGFPNRHGKGSMYEGGVRVPLIISGKDVNRKGVEEFGLTQANDLYATIIEQCIGELPGGIYNSYSIRNSFSQANSIERNYTYTDYLDDDVLSWAIRNQDYKLIQDVEGRLEFYNISQSLREQNNLIDDLNEEEAEILSELQAEAQAIRTGWSCQDFIQNGDETEIDKCGLINSTFEFEAGTIDIFPNPVSDVLNIQLQGGLDFKASIYNLNGSVLKQSLNPKHFEVDDLSNGIYFLYIEDLNSNQKQVSKITVNR